MRQTIDSTSHPALFLVDGVSSIGALDFQFDEWKVDVAVTGSQKAMSLPTGLAMVAISDKVNIFWYFYQIYSFAHKIYCFTSNVISCAAGMSWQGHEMAWMSATNQSFFAFITMRVKKTGRLIDTTMGPCWRDVLFSINVIWKRQFQCFPSEFMLSGIHLSWAAAKGEYLVLQDIACVIHQAAYRAKLLKLKQSHNSSDLTIHDSSSEMPINSVTFCRESLHKS